MNIKAIETQYQGYCFRSRLEARWAVFFDALGVKYEYEPEGFELQSFDLDRREMFEKYREIAERNNAVSVLETLIDRLDALSKTKQFYLPDFWLPEGQMWAEVKAVNSVDLVEIDKAMRLVNESGFPLVWCIELTGNALKGLLPDADRRPNKAEFVDVHFGRSSQQLMRAANAARAARFEHGETPRIGAPA